MNWKSKIKQINKLLNQLEISDQNRNLFDPDIAFAMLLNRTLYLRQKRKTIYCIGNGASASMASHFSADMAKNGKVHTEVFSDLALITAISNDMSYEEVFAEPLQRRGKSGDMLLAISSSGKSPNILRCAETAKELQMSIITLSAMHGDNPLRRCGDINFYFPAFTYGEAESLHALILHYWTDLLVEETK